MPELVKVLGHAGGEKASAGQRYRRGFEHASEFVTYIRAETTKWASVIKGCGNVQAVD